MMNSLSGAFYPQFAAPITESGINRGVDAFSRVWPLPFEQYIIQRFDDLVSRMDFLNSIVLARGGVTAVEPFPSVPLPVSQPEVEPSPSSPDELSTLPYNTERKRYAIPILPPAHDLFPVSSHSPLLSPSHSPPSPLLERPLTPVVPVRSPSPVLIPVPVLSPSPEPIPEVPASPLPDVVPSVPSAGPSKPDAKPSNIHDMVCPAHRFCTSRKCVMKHPKGKVSCEDANKCDGSCGKKYHKCFHKPQCTTKQCSLLHEPGQRSAINLTVRAARKKKVLPVTPPLISDWERKEVGKLRQQLSHDEAPSDSGSEVVLSKTTPVVNVTSSVTSPNIKPETVCKWKSLPVEERPWFKFCSQRSGPFAVKVIEGAPGSGKTKHLIDIISTYSVDSTIHVATSSYKACFELGCRLESRGIKPFCSPLEVKNPTDLAMQRKRKFYPSYVSGRSPKCAVILFVTSMLRSNVIKAIPIGRADVSRKVALSEEEEKTFWKISKIHADVVNHPWNVLTADTITPAHLSLEHKGYLKISKGVPSILSYPAQTIGKYSLSRRTLPHHELRHFSQGVSFLLPDVLIFDEASTVPSYQMNSLQVGVSEVYLLGDRNQRRPIPDPQELALLTDFDETKSYFTSGIVTNTSFLHSASRCPRDVYRFLAPFYPYLDIPSINTIDSTSDKPSSSDSLCLIPRLASVKLAEAKGQLCLTVDESQGSTSRFVEVYTLSPADVGFLHSHVESAIVAMTRHTEGFIWWDMGKKKTLKNFYHTFIQNKHSDLVTPFYKYAVECKKVYCAETAGVVGRLIAQHEDEQQKYREQVRLQRQQQQEHQQQQQRSAQKEEELRAQQHQLEQLAREKIRKLEESEAAVIAVSKSHQESMLHRVEHLISQAELKVKAATGKTIKELPLPKAPLLTASSEVVSKSTPTLTKKEKKQRQQEEYHKSHSKTNTTPTCLPVSEPPLRKEKDPVEDLCSSMFTAPTSFSPKFPAVDVRPACKTSGCTYRGVCLDAKGFCLEHRDL